MFIGLKEVYRRIPLTRSISLEEAEVAVRTPPQGQATYSFRETCEKEARSRGQAHNEDGNRGGGTSGDLTEMTRAGTSHDHPRPAGNRASHPSEAQTSPENPPRTGPSKAKKGTVNPRHSVRVQKYSYFLGPGPVELLLKKHMRKNVLLKRDPKFLNTCLNLIAASLARNTWKKYNSALRLWENFREQSRDELVFLDLGNWSQRFLIWGWEVRRLSVSTLKAYLGTLEKLKSFAIGLETMGCGLEKTLLKGMSNLAAPKKEKRELVFPLTIAALRKIREKLGKFEEKLTGQSVWACCLIAFWGAFRLGELLGKDGHRFDKFSDLLWEDIAWGEDWVKIRIKSAKVKGPPGNSALLYAVPARKLCPVTALARLKKSQENFNMGTDKEPIFREEDGKFLTKRNFLKIVNEGRGNDFPAVTGKSFRSGLPSALENFPVTFQESHLKALGRWRGRSYQLYMRNDEPEFRWVYKLVSSVLLQGNSVQENWKSDPATWTASWDFQKGNSARKEKQNLAPNRTVMPKKREGKNGKEQDGSESQNYPGEKSGARVSWKTFKKIGRT